ncbi:MAG: capsular biosynthesis protein, partial [Proteobacteria bacterium]|nr:capsular biosynthesis protein [Pseudomonadota bacterium]
SPFCSTGLYWFRSVGLFSEAFAVEEHKPSGSELYVAPLYQHLIKANRDIRFGVIGLDEIFFSGTPDEYQSALADQARIQMKFVD